VNADPVLVAIACFALGMVVQALFMLGGRFQRGDWGRAGWALAFWLIGLFSSDHEPEYHLLQHVSYGMLVAGVVFTYLFRDRLLPRVGGRLLLSWNLLVVYVAVRSGWNSTLQIFLILIPTVPTVVNAFTDIDNTFAWKVFYQAWFSTILAVIALYCFDLKLFDVFEAQSSVAPAGLPSPFEMIAGGAAFLYIVTNAWFVLALVPIAGRGQSWGSRMKEIREHMNLLARGYVWEHDDPLRSLAVLVGLPVALVAISVAGADVRSVIPFAISIMPLAAGPAEPEPPVLDAEAEPPVRHTKKKLPRSKRRRR
jgi:hypothetical protein